MKKQSPTLKRDNTTYPNTNYLHAEHLTGDKTKFPQWDSPEEKEAIKQKCINSIKTTVQRCKKSNP